MSDRAARVQELAAQVQQVGAARYEVPGSNAPHVVVLEHPSPSCDCRDFAYRGRQRPCIHIEAAVAFRDRNDAWLAGEDDSPHLMDSRGEGNRDLVQAVESESHEVLDRIEGKLAAMEAQVAPSAAVGGVGKRYREVLARVAAEKAGSNRG